MAIANVKIHRMCSYTDTQLVENSIICTTECWSCDAQIGDTHSRACPNGERYKQVQQLTASGKSLPEIIPGYIDKLKAETLADIAEAWTRGKGEEVPGRDTIEWSSMYEAWIEFAFDHSKDEGKTQHSKHKGLNLEDI